MTGKDFDSDSIYSLLQQYQNKYSKSKSSNGFKKNQKKQQVLDWVYIFCLFILNILFIWNLYLQFDKKKLEQ